MDLAFTDEREHLRQTARRYLAANSCAEQPTQRVWRDLVDLGWLDPDLGGVNLAVLAEETGYALSPGWWFATGGLAGVAYLAGGRPPDRPATLAWAEPPTPATLAVATQARCRAAAGARGVTLTGVKCRVPDAATVEEAVVVARGDAGVALYRLDLTAHRDVVEPVSTVDGSRPIGTIRLADTPAEPLVPAEAAVDVLVAVRARGYTMIAAEALGVARRALELAVAHAQTRTQFGRPVGAYQGVSHRLADAYAAQELARSLVYRAAWTLDAGSPDGSDGRQAELAAVIAAKEAAVRTCETAIQVLGGNGFTWEHPLRRLYRRALWIAAFDGHPAAHRAELAALLLGDVRMPAATAGTASA